MFDGMVKKNSMHGLPYRIVSPEGKADVAHPTAYFGSRQILFDPFGSSEKINCVVFMLIHSCGYRENIGIKNDITLFELHFLGKDIIAAPANLYSSFICICLPFFIKC